MGSWPTASPPKSARGGRRPGLPVPDPEAVRYVDPMDAAEAERKRSPAPVVHGTKEDQEAWWERYDELKAAYKVAHRLLEVAGRPDARPLIPFPAGTIPPSHARKKLRLRAESG
ncbi:MAG: hypothetical protein R3F43_29725 [bacterium]